MQYFFDFVGFQDYTLADKKNLKLVAIVFKDKDLEDDAKLKYQKKHWTRLLSIQRII